MLFAACQARWDDAFAQIESTLANFQASLQQTEQLNAALHAKIVKPSEAQETLHAAACKTQRLNAFLNNRSKEIQLCVDNLPNPKNVENNCYQIVAKVASEAVDNTFILY